MVAENQAGYFGVSLDQPGRPKPYQVRVNRGGKRVGLGYFGVRLANPGQPKPYQAQVRRGGKTAHLGYFATAEEAALCVARSPEGQAAARRARASAER